MILKFITEQPSALDFPHGLHVEALYEYLRTSISSLVFKSSGFQGQSLPSLIAIRIVLRGNATIELSETTTTTGNEKISKSERAKHFLPG